MAASAGREAGGFRWVAAAEREEADPTAAGRRAESGRQAQVARRQVVPAGRAEVLKVVRVEPRRAVQVKEAPRREALHRAVRGTLQVRAVQRVLER